MQIAMSSLILSSFSTPGFVLAVRVLLAGHRKTGKLSHDASAKMLRTSACASQAEQSSQTQCKTATIPATTGNPHRLPEKEGLFGRPFRLSTDQAAMVSGMVLPWLQTKLEFRLQDKLNAAEPERTCR